MVNEYLSETMIRSGAALTGELEKAGLHPDMVFWYYDNSPEKWVLVVADNKIADWGYIELYTKIRDALAESSEDIKELFFDRIALMYPHQRLVASLRDGAKKGQVRAGRRLTGSIIAGSWIEDAYIYRAA